MTPLVQAVTTILSFGTLILSIVVVLGFLAYLFAGRSSVAQHMLSWVSIHALLLGFIISLGAMLGSLFYSVIAGFEPCNLCWWIRILLFPQVLIFALALYKKYKHHAHDLSFVWTISIPMSLIATLIALYTYYGQSFNNTVLAFCGSAGPSCAKLYFTTFGYITIPFMSLAVSAALLLIGLIRKKF